MLPYSESLLMADAHIHKAVADAALGSRDGDEIDVSARAHISSPSRDGVDDGEINVVWIAVGSSILPLLDGQQLWIEEWLNWSLG